MHAACTPSSDGNPSLEVADGPGDNAAAAAVASAAQAHWAAAWANYYSYCTAELQRHQHAASHHLQHEYAAAWASGPVLSTTSSLLAGPCVSTCSSSPSAAHAAAAATAAGALHPAEPTADAWNNGVAAGVPVVDLVAAYHLAQSQQQQQQPLPCDDEATSSCRADKATATAAAGVRGPCRGARAVWQRPAGDRQHRLHVACLIARWLRARGLDEQLGGGTTEGLNRAVRRLEGLLYVAAHSCDEYMDEASLAQRIRALVVRSSAAGKAAAAAAASGWPPEGSAHGSSSGTSSSTSRAASKYGTHEQQHRPRAGESHERDAPRQ